MRQLITRTSDLAFVYGQGAVLQDLNELATEIAGTNIPVLLVGESGTGKDVYARRIHRGSGAPENAFVRISCGSFDICRMLNNLREAFQPQDGRLETLPKTVYLDGVHELNDACQRTLLSLFPEDCESESVVGNLPRIVSSTLCNLDKEIEVGRFRPELYFRINGAILRLPALRERKEDIPDLLEWFLVKHSRELGKCVPEIGREGRKLLFSYNWPGNIRELENVARKIVATGDADFALDGLRASQLVESARNGVADVTALKTAVRAACRRTERELILKALEKTHWNRKRAAHDLQISYKSLLLKMKHIGEVAPLAKKNEGKCGDGFGESSN